LSFEFSSRSCLWMLVTARILILVASNYAVG
jgi:hypothetical protein